MALYSNFILVLPSNDLAESKEILRKRFKETMTSTYDYHESFIRSGTFEKVAKQLSILKVKPRRR